MDLAHARGREGVVVPRGEDLLGRAELGGDHLARGLARERRGLRLEALQHLLEFFFVAGRGEAIDVRGHLPQLEREALHLAERLQHGLGGGLRVGAQGLAPALDAEGAHGMAANTQFAVTGFPSDGWGGRAVGGTGSRGEANGGRGFRLSPSSWQLS